MSMSVRIALALVAPLTSPFQGAEEEAFQAGLLAVERGLRAREWEETPARIAALLEQHEGRSYVWLSRPRLVDALRLAAFLPGYRPPGPEELVEGELRSYSPSTGKMRIVYRQGQLGEFLVLRDGELQPAAGKPLGEEDLLLHPAEFRRGCSVTVRGTDYGRGGTLPGVTCILPTRILFVSFGQTGLGRRDRPAVLADYFRQEVLDQAESPARPGEPYAFEVQVKEREILGLWKNRRVLHGKKERDEFGRFGIHGVSGWEEIEVEGVASRAWMQGLQDGAFQRALLSFTEDFDEDAGLPAWLRFERLGWTERLARQLPGWDAPEHGERARDLLQRLDDGEEEDVRRRLADLDPADVGEDLYAFVFCLLEVEQGDLDAARERAERLRALAPSSLPARLLPIWIEGLSDDPEEACVRFAELALEVAPDPTLLGAQALFALATGDREQAEEVLRLAVAGGLYGELLDEVGAVLCKALTGPSWLESHEVETEHFRVVSDIDERTCREAAGLLETALDHFQSRHRSLPKGRAERFPVYLFSGEIGYQLYLVDTTLFPAESSLGAFVPGMGQLLIWNVPDRTRMLNTVRHEGLHQYMHRLMRDQPVWLAEGLGEYWEEADFSKSKSLQNQPSQEKLLAVRALRRDFLPLERFLHVPRGEFYGNVSLSYTQAWAFVHFLQHSGREHLQLFDALLDELIAGSDADEAIEAVFGGRDLAELEAAFGRYLSELR